MKVSGSVALIATIVGVAPSAQVQFPTKGMPDEPVVIRTAAATVKVSAIKGSSIPGH